MRGCLGEADVGIMTETDGRDRQVTVPVTKVALDFVLLMCVGFPILFLFLWGQPFRRGFFCLDDSIRHPFHESTVPSIYLYIIGLFMNCVVMTITECFNTSPYDRAVVFMGHKVPVWMWRSYCVIGVFAFGAACSQLTTDIMKYTIGRLRPHFYTVCLPDVNCSLPENIHKYHVNFNCTNPLYVNNWRIMKELRLSFPSGHSSFSIYTMLYFAIYIQARMTWNGSKLLKHTIQFLAIIAAIFTAMTRVSDYKHHWSDVLSGLLIGTITACVVGKFVSTLFEREEKRLRKNSATAEMNNLNGNSLCTV